MALTVASVIERREYEVKRLLTHTPPQFRHEHKRAIIERLRLERSGSTLRYSRWQPGTLPNQLLNHQPVISIKPSVYDYAGPSEAVWHVNFADPELFVAYAGRLLAQDELQVLEHPSLAALKEALVAEGLPAVTETESEPTPVLITGIERLGHLNTQPTIERPQGLYGNEFARAPLAEVLSALTINSPPTLTNMIAIAAPVGRGRYTLKQLERTLLTAFTGLTAASRESRAIWPGAPVEIRTGFWGCGAFGGNRTVMIMLQALAARMAGVDKLTLHTVRRNGIDDVELALEQLKSILAATPDHSVAGVLATIEGRGFQWGVGNGT